MAAESGCYKLSDKSAQRTCLYQQKDILLVVIIL